MMRAAMVFALVAIVPVLGWREYGECEEHERCYTHSDCPEDQGCDFDKCCSSYHDKHCLGGLMCRKPLICVECTADDNTDYPGCCHYPVCPPSKHRCDYHEECEGTKLCADGCCEPRSHYPELWHELPDSPDRRDRGDWGDH